MQNINIGKSGIQVPFLGMGTWAIGGGAWWGDNDDSLSVKAIQTAVEQGIQWIDTAPIYGLYHSETVVGEAMKHIDRDKVVLSTKCGLEWRHETPVLHKVVDGTTVYRDLSAKSIIEDVEDSLRRLHTDHLDVLYTHWQTPDFGIYPLEETVEAMMKLKEQGKIRAIGAPAFTAEDTVLDTDAVCVCRGIARFDRGNDFCGAVVKRGDNRTCAAENIDNNNRVSVQHIVVQFVSISYNINFHQNHHPFRNRIHYNILGQNFKCPE